MFHVPEQSRIITGRAASNSSYGNNGAFSIYKGMGLTLWIIASDGMGWEHVSVHAEVKSKPQTPSWDDMCFIKDLFWDAEDIVIQLHPAKSEYINVHPNTLHLWRPIGIEIPHPPKILVG